MARLTEPSAFRTAQLASLDDEFSNLVEHDLGLKDAFLDLCCQTHDALDPGLWGKRICYRPCPSSVLNLSLPGPDETRDCLPLSLQQRWLAWRTDYARLIARNPRLDLADKMEEVSEIIDASSWPYGQEDAIKPAFPKQLDVYAPQITRNVLYFIMLI